MYNILLIEDDTALNKAISVYFKKEKFLVLSCFSGQEALDTFSQNNSDLIILDINLPDLSGFDLIEQIKIMNLNIPILILSACDLDSDILHGFNLGAEDYVTKPFNIEILHKKINVILKRNTKNIFYKDDHLFFDKNTSKLVINNEETKLTPLEFKLLSFFLENQNQILLKETIIEKIWDSNENYVDEIYRVYNSDICDIIIIVAHIMNHPILLPEHIKRVGFKGINKAFYLTI